MTNCETCGRPPVDRSPLLPFDKAVNDYIARRLAEGHKQQDIAEALGIRQQRVSEVKLGRRAAPKGAAQP